MTTGHTLHVLLGLLAIRGLAQAPMSLCTASDCGNCPNTVTTAGTGFPACVIYDRDTVLGDTKGDYEQTENSARLQVYFDIAEPEDPNCRYIVRSPAGTTDENCGEPVLSSKGGLCAATTLGVDTTFMVQICCGPDECDAAGVPFRKRSGGSTSLVLRDPQRNVIVPSAVGDAAGDMLDVFMEDMGVHSSSAVQSTSSAGVPIWKIGYPEEPVKKRDCDSYTPDGDIYSKTGDNATLLTGRICGDGSTTSLTNENSVSRSTTFSMSVGDPFGIVSRSIEFTIEETSTQSYTYMFTPPTGQCGRVSWTPFYLCSGGTISGCEGGPEQGEVCTAKRIDENHFDGSYSFLISD